MARQSIGTISVDFEANTVNFMRGMDRATTQLKQTQKSFDGLVTGARAVGKALGALGLAYGGTQLVAFGRQALEAAGNLGELSQQIGISTDLIQALEYAGTQTNVAMAELENGMRYLTRTIGDAAAGEATAVEAFEKAAIKWRDSSGQIKTTEAVLRDIADRIKAVGTDAERAAIAADFFGSRMGAKLIPVLMNGSAGLDEFIAKAREMGLIWDDAMIKSADEAADKWAELELRLKKFGQTVAIEVLPPLFDLMDAAEQWRVDTLMENWQGDLEDALENLVKLRAAAAPPVVLQIAHDQLDAALEKLGLIEEAQHRIAGPDISGSTPNTPSGPEAVSLPVPMGKDYEAEAEAASAAADAAAKAAADRAKAINQVIESLQFETDQLARTAEQQEIYNQLKAAGVTAESEAGQTIIAMVTHLQDLRAELETAAEAQAQFDDDTKAIAAVVAETETPLEKYEARIKELNRLFETGRLPAQNYWRAMTQASEDLRAANEALDKNDDAIRDQEDAMRDAAAAGREWGNEIAGVLLKTRDLESVAMNALQRIIDMLLQAIFATDELGSSTSGLGGIFSQIFGGGKTSKGGGGFFGAILNGIGSIFGGAGGMGGGGGSGAVGGSPVFMGFPTFGGPRAGGGDVSAGFAYRINEKGEEWFVPGGKGSVVPASSGMGGGHTTVYEIDARGADISVEQRIMRVLSIMDANFEPRTRVAVMDARHRGGAFAASFRR